MREGNLILLCFVCEGSSMFGCMKKSVLGVFLLVLCLIFNASDTVEQLQAVPEQKNVAINRLPSKYCIIHCCFVCVSQHLQFK